LTPFGRTLILVATTEKGDAVGFTDTYDTGKYKLAPKDAVVLDLSTAPGFTRGDRFTGYPSHAECLVGLLRGCGSQTADWVADQIEAQTKPPRIPEPGWGGIVAARGVSGIRMKWVRGERGWTNLDATGDHLNWTLWDELTDPVLVREGV
jgi:hypothetical protein